MAIDVIVSNGCKLSDFNCGLIRKYVSNLIQRIYNDENENVPLVVLRHDLDDSVDVIGGDRESVLLAIDGLECGDEVDEVDFDSRLKILLDELNNSNGFESQKNCSNFIL